MVNIKNYTFAVDFDGTIVEDAYPEIGKPNGFLISKLKRLKAEGNTLILWTCRAGEFLNDAVEFCKAQGLEFDYVNENPTERINAYGSDTRKISADFYVDDKNVSIKDFMCYHFPDLKSRLIKSISKADKLEAFMDKYKLDRLMDVDIEQLLEFIKIENIKEIENDIFSD